MKKNTRTLLLLCVAIIFAILAGVGVYAYCNPAKITVYVYNGNYAAGTPFSAEMITPIEVDSKIVIAGKKGDASKAYVTENEIEGVLNGGNYLLYDVSAGTTVTPSALSKVMKNSIERNLDSDTIAVTIPVNNYSGVTSNLRVGARVNVYSSSNGSTNLAFEGMRVIGVSKIDNNLQSITVECTYEQSVSLIHAISYSEIYLGLVDNTQYLGG